MKIVPQSDTSGDFSEDISPVVKQNTPRNEEVLKPSDPSPGVNAVSEKKVPDNDGGAMKVVLGVTIIMRISPNFGGVKQEHTV